jgi:hypothetical protein
VIKGCQGRVISRLKQYDRWLDKTIALAVGLDVSGPRRVAMRPVHQAGSAEIIVNPASGTPDSSANNSSIEIKSPARRGNPILDDDH